ncbi:MAG: hypothetical protein ACRC80_21695 [Waterburya sp.]
MIFWYNLGQNLPENLMNTSVHIPQDLSERLNTYLKYHKISKNKFIIEAITQALNEKENKEAWHPDLMNGEGVPEFEAGSLDAELLPMAENIL